MRTSVRYASSSALSPLGEEDSLELAKEPDMEPRDVETLPSESEAEPRESDTALMELEIFMSLEQKIMLPI